MTSFMIGCIIGLTLIALTAKHPRSLRFILWGMWLIVATVVLIIAPVIGTLS